MKFLTSTISIILCASLGTQAEEIVLDEIEVIGTDQKRYRPEAAKSITGVELSYLELPRIVETIPEQLILDQKITEIEDALRNVPGVTLGDGFGGVGNDYYIRGFRRESDFRDGIRLGGLRENMAGVERVMVVKGPASITYGQVEPGGIVDIITKKPLKEARNFIEMRAGSHNEGTILLDASQPIGEKGAVRINLSSQRSDGWRDFAKLERDGLSISATYDLNENTAIDAQYEYGKQVHPFDRGTITVPVADGTREIINNLLNIPLTRRFGEAEERLDATFSIATLGLTHKLGEEWKLRFVGTYADMDTELYQARPQRAIVLDKDEVMNDGYFLGALGGKPAFTDPTDQVFLSRLGVHTKDRKTTVSSLSSLLSGVVETGDIVHSISIGADYRKFKDNAKIDLTSPALGIPGFGALFDTQNPVYGNMPTNIFDQRTLALHTVNYGIFMNDYLNITDKLSLLIGGRFDFVDVDGDGPREKVSAFSPQVALNYFMYENISVFTSYSEAFKPNTLSPDRTLNTELLDPEDSNQIELGIKAQYFDNMLDISLAMYKITKNNVLDLDDSTGLVNVIGEIQSKGFEFSVNGQPMSGMNIFAGYSYTDVEITEGRNKGNQPRNVANSTFNLWLSHEFQKGTLSGFGLGAGAFYVSDRYGDNANSWTLGDATVVDASLWYTLPFNVSDFKSDVRLQLSGKNLFNEVYYSASGGDLRVSIGAPRTVLFSVSATF